MNSNVKQEMSLSDEQIAHIHRVIEQNQSRVSVLNLDGRSVVVKREQPQRKQYGYLTLRWLAGVLRLPVLNPVAFHGGADAQAVEVRRLTQLRAAGVSVPEVLHVANGWFAMSSVGHSSIDAQLRKSDDALTYWEKGLAAILDVHQKGQNLSQVFARNMMWHDEDIVFIDFEDDPALTLGLVHAQARDWLFYVFSSMWLLDVSPSQAAAIMMTYLKQDDLAVQSTVKKSCGTLAWLRFLPSKRKPWGRDVVAAQGAGAILHELQKLQ